MDPSYLGSIKRYRPLADRTKNVTNMRMRVSYQHYKTYEANFGDC
jgi:hypothetical protein